ncbi:MAG: hypothetical protein ACR2MT_16330, partial [Aurantibacter sp.]
MSLFLFLFAAAQLCAQTVMVKVEKEKNEVQKYTVMEKFEPNLVIPADERKRRKDERKQLIAHRRSILDTLSISDRRRQRLLRELSKNPFSDRINRTFADI